MTGNGAHKYLILALKDQSKLLINFCLLSFISKQCESFTFENQSKYISQLRQCLPSIYSIFYTKRFLYCLCNYLRSKLMSFNFQLQTL
jgi:hypothetical protein